MKRICLQILIIFLQELLHVQTYEIGHVNSLHNITKRSSSYAGGIDYLGIGYNLLYGNPDGSPTTAAQDPGLRSTWRVFEWTFNDGSIPDQVVYSQSASCAETKNLQLFHNAYAYSSKFDADISVSGSAKFKFGSTKFSHSSYYQEVTSSMESNSYVYYEEENYCHLGEARLKTELAQIDKYPLTRSFVQRVNLLPNEYSTNDLDYMTFLDDFGTHVVTEVILGTKYVERYRWTRSEFASYSAEHYSSSTSLGGSYLGYSGSISVDTSSVEESMINGDSSALQVETFTLGDDHLALPYSYSLIGMNEIFEPEFWSLNEDYVNDGVLSAGFSKRLATMKSNMEQALTEYPDWLHSIEAKEDAIVTLPLTWPSGSYGLPKTNSGCPTTPGFLFHSGYLYQDTEDNNNNNNWSNPNHFVEGSLGNNLFQHFCMKTQEQVTNYDGDWPEGQYCIFQASSDGCPSGMKEGYIRWDDEDTNNNNRISGSVPRGEYGRNSLLYYCCNVDGFAENAIYLPTDSPFYLFPQTHICQTVAGMTVQREYIRWDNEDDNNNDYAEGVYPFKENESKNHLIYYCYYTPNK